MKLTKIFAIAVAALALNSCSDDDNDFNTATDVTVDMAQPTMTTRENSKFLYVPIKVTGDANGPIVVTVETTPTGTEPAVADENYLVTSYEIIIPADTKEGSVEIVPVDNIDENDPRTFNVTIKSAQGAKLGTDLTTLVTLKDNDQDPYEKMTGTWEMTCSSVFTNGDNGPFTLTMETPDPDEEAEWYGHELYAFGLKGYDFVLLPFNFAYNELTDEVTMSIQVGSLCTTSLINFGFQAVVVGTSVYSPGTVNFGHDIPVTVTGYDKIEQTDPDDMFLLTVMPYSGGVQMQNKGYWDGWYNITLTRK